MELTFEFFISWIRSWFTAPKPPPLSPYVAPKVDPIPTKIKPLPVTVVSRELSGFFNVVRKEFGRLSQKQVNGYSAILAKAFELETPTTHLAYMLATAYHETDATMQPIEEYGRGAGRAYGKPDPITKLRYYGRGLVQLTWKSNYDKYGIALRPERALEMEMAVHIMFDGMTKGIFTGKKLGDYFTREHVDPVGARRIINGTDKAKKIAGYYDTFLRALNEIHIF